MQETGINTHLQSIQSQNAGGKNQNAYCVFNLVGKGANEASLFKEQKLLAGLEGFGGKGLLDILADPAGAQSSNPIRAIFAGAFPAGGLKQWLDNTAGPWNIEGHFLAQDGTGRQYLVLQMSNQQEGAVDALQNQANFAAAHSDAAPAGPLHYNPDAIVPGGPAIPDNNYYPHHNDRPIVDNASNASSGSGGGGGGSNHVFSAAVQPGAGLSGMSGGAEVPMASLGTFSPSHGRGQGREVSVGGVTM